MTIFEAVKSRVTLRNAAERFGLTVTHDGRARCPFHDDWHLSLKLTDKTFFCSGCGASGDVIEFTCDGEDENEALKAIVEAVESGLGE